MREFDRVRPISFLCSSLLSRSGPLPFLLLLTSPPPRLSLTPLTPIELKELNEWPTVPQLIIKGEFVGGLDVVKEMQESGELQEMLEAQA
jgi:hypothetical protein